MDRFLQRRERIRQTVRSNDVHAFSDQFGDERELPDRFQRRLVSAAHRC